MQKIEWQAIYDDGETLSQYNEKKGRENKYTDIDRSRLVQFVLLADDIPKLVIHHDKNKRLIYRRRIAMVFSGPPAGKAEGGNLSTCNQETVHIVGWQERKKGVNTQMICFLFEDGHVEVVDRFREQHPWFYPVIFLPEEELIGGKEKK